MKVQIARKKYTMRDKPNGMARFFWKMMLRELNRGPKFEVVEVVETDSNGAPSPGNTRA